ncbi:MAG: SwmB domain-containing protein [Nitrosomonas sp.]
MNNNQLEILQIAQAMFNAASGDHYLSEFTMIIDNANGTTRQLANLLAETDVFKQSMYAETLTNHAFSSQFVENMVGSLVNADNKTWAVSTIETMLAEGQSRGDVIYWAATALAAVDTADINWGEAAQQFNNKVQVAAFYSIDQKGSANSLAILQAVTASVTNIEASVNAAKARLESGASGKVIDGYVSNAIIFADLNDDGVLNQGEISTTTGAFGNFTLSGIAAFGHLIVSGGTDISTGKPFEGIMTAPAGSTVVNPLTTLIGKLTENGTITVEEATSKVLANLGLNVGINLLNFDPIKETVRTDTDASATGIALTIQAAAIQINILTSQTAALLNGVGVATSEGAGIESAYAALASYFESMGATETIDLTSSAVIEQVIQMSAIKSGANATQITAVAALSTVAAQTIANLNQAIDDAAQGNTSTLAALTQITAIQIVAEAVEGTMQSGAAKGNVSNTVFSTTGTALTNAINTAGKTVGDVNGDGKLDALSTSSSSSTSELDKTAPVFASATINGNRLVMTYTETNLLNTSTASTATFAVFSDGVANPVVAVTVSPISKTVTLTLTTPVTHGQVVTVAYSDPSTANDVNAIQDQAGNDAPTLALTLVTNNTVEPESIINGTDGADRLNGGAGIDIINADAGDDIIRGGAGVDKVYAGDGNDKIVIVGDLSRGGKIDTDEDTNVLGEPLTNLNGLNLNEDENGVAEIVDGGAGEDTLYVYGTADISKFNITGIEHIEIRSNVTFSEALFKDKNIRTIMGDGSSVINIAGGSASDPLIVDFTAADAIQLGRIGHINLGEHVVFRIDTLDKLGGAQILTGNGKIEFTSNNVALPATYSVADTIQINNADGSSAKGSAEILNHVIYGIAAGTDAQNQPITHFTDQPGSNDYLVGTAYQDIFEVSDGNDVLTGKDGNDTYIITGSGNKVILDEKGIDTLDLSQASFAANIDLKNGGTVGSNTLITLGSNNSSGATQQDAPKANVMLIFDVSGSMSSGSRLNLAKQAAKDLLDAYDGKGDVAVRIVTFESSARSSFSGIDTWMDIDAAKGIINGLNAGGLTNYDAAIEVAKSAFVSGQGSAYFEQGGNVSYFLSDGEPNSRIDYKETTWEDFLIQSHITSYAIGFGGLSSTSALEPIAFDGVKVASPTDDHAPGEISASIEVDTQNLGSTLIAAAKLDFIENLVGTAFADTLTGNSLDNKIEGGAENDLLEGKGGNDTLIGDNGEDVTVFTGAFSEYDITPNGYDLVVTDKVTNRAGGSNGTDTLNTIEILRFSDGDKNASDFITLQPSENIFEFYNTLYPDLNNDGGYYRFFFDQSSASYVHKGLGPGDENQDESPLNQNSMDMLNKTPGFHFLSKSEFGLLANDTDGIGEASTTYLGGLSNDFKYQFEEGHYVAYDETLFNTSSVANVGRSADALFLTFRGTNTLADWFDDFLAMGEHYERYQPLVDAIDKYLAANKEINTVYVSGHSLGGQMAMEYMKAHPNTSTVKFEAVTFEAANKWVSWLSADELDDRFTNFEMRGDIVPDFSLDNYGKTIHLEYETSPFILSHSMSNIEKEIIPDDPETLDKNEAKSHFNRTVSTIDRRTINSNNSNERIYLDEDKDNVIVTQITAPVVEPLVLEGLLRLIPFIGPLLSKVALPLIQEFDKAEYRSTEYNIKTVFDNPGGILVLRHLLGIDDGEYIVTERNVGTVIIGDDTVSKSENIDINGSAANWNLMLVGNAGNNRLSGGSDIDILVGGADKDLLIGGESDDYLVGSGYNQIPFTSATLERIKDLIGKYADGAAWDRIDADYFVGGLGKDTMYGGRPDSSAIDQDGDNDYFFIHANQGANNNASNVDTIKDFYVSGSDLTAEDYLIFAADQLGISSSQWNSLNDFSLDMSGLTTTNPEAKAIPISIPVISPNEHFFKVDDIGAYQPDNSNDDEFAFILDHSTGNLWFDLDGNRDIGDEYLLANISVLPNESDKLSDMHANQIVIVGSFDFIA